MLQSPKDKHLSLNHSGGKACLSPGGALSSYHQRAFAHNYHAPFIYHIILKKQQEFDYFGKVCGNAGIPYGSAGCAFIEEAQIGKIIAKKIIEIQRIFPFLQVYQFKVMPDHVHILLRVKEWTDYHLDYYIESLKNLVAEAYSHTIGNQISTDTIFTPGYCDKPLLINRNLDTLFRYIRENPHRLAVRMQYPQFFQRIRTLKIGEEEFEAYGNLFLFRNPDKEAVKISHKFSEQEKQNKKNFWLESASKGTVLVSPFISAEEKAIRMEAESLGSKIILIVREALPDRYKPSAQDFLLCSEGRLLIISLGLPPKTPLTRPICERMNALAKSITEL